MIHSFLLIGQSNMAGRGYLNEEPPIENESLKVLKNGRWQPMFRPINYDRPFAGISLAEWFADCYAKEHGATVGIIPCADGGTSLNQWCEGGLLYDHAVCMAKLAQRTSTIAGVLWHQGEADCRDDYYPFYQEKFTKIMAALRRDLNLYDVPFLLGGLGDFLQNCGTESGAANYVHINESLKAIAKNNAMTGFVSAEGLTSNPDNLHFNTKSLITFGLRYYDVFKTLEDKTKVFEEKCHEDDAIREAETSF